MLKKTIAVIGPLLILATAGTALAVTTIVVPPEVLTCISDAVSTREQLLGSAVNTYTQSINSAYAVRKDALNQVYTSTTTVSGIRTGIRAAWSTFGTSFKLARNAWRTVRASAWRDYKTATMACRSTYGISDSIQSWLEMY